MSKFKLLPCIIVMAVMLGIVQMASAGAIGTPAVDYTYLRNISGQTMNNGEVVFWATGTTVGYGYEVTFNNTASTSLVAGIAAATIPNGQYGRIQVSGYHAAIKVDTTEVAIAIGDSLVPAQNQYGLLKSTAEKTAGYFVSLEAESIAPYSQGAPGVLKDSSTVPTVKGIIRLESIMR